MAPKKAAVPAQAEAAPSPPQINQILHAKFRKAIATIFRAVVASTGFAKDWAVSMLFEHPVIEVGPPGVGKTLLARVTSRVLCGQDAAVVNCFEDARPEDLLYDVGIAQLHGAGRSDWTFDVKPRDPLTEPFVLLNEWNRLTPRTQNVFLGVFSEGHVTVRGARLAKERGKVLLDMNPYYGPMGDLATRDRFVACLYVEEIGIADRFVLANRKYAQGHVEDLAATVEPVMSVQDLFETWDDVKRVQVPPSELAKLQLAASVFSSCVYKLGSVSDAFRDRLKCEECALRRHCVTRYLRQPLSPRLGDAVILLAKAHAWYEGRGVVDTKRDMMPALRLAIGHKVELREDAAAEYPNVSAWFERVVMPLLQSRKGEWSQARATYEAIEKALAKGNVAEAGRTLRKFQKATKDVTARNLVGSAAEPLLEAKAEPLVQQVREKLDLMLSGQASYTTGNLDEIVKETSWFPERYQAEVSDGIGALRYRMKGAVVVEPEAYMGLLQDLAKLDPGVLTGLITGVGIPRGRLQYTAKDSAGSVGTITVVPQGGKLEVTYEARQSELADVMVRHGAE